MPPPVWRLSPQLLVALPDLQYFVNEGQDLPPALSSLRRCEEGPGLSIAPLPHGLPEESDILLEEASLVLVGLGKDQRERNLSCDKPLHEFEVNPLRRMAGVNQDEGAEQVLTPHQVIRDKFLKFCPLGLGYLGVSIPREIYKAPRLINHKKVDLTRTTGTTRHASQPLRSGHKIYEGRFANIGTPYKGKLRQCRFGAAFKADCTAFKSGGVNLHAYQNATSRSRTVQQSPPTFIPRPLEATPSGALSR